MPKPKKSTFFGNFFKMPAKKPGRKVRYQIVGGDMTKFGGLVKKRKEKDIPYTKREKKIGYATIEGAGAGFVTGGLLGGLGGMVLGMPIGAFSANVYARNKYKSHGRQTIKFTPLQTLFSTRDERYQKVQEVKKIGYAHAKTIKKRREYR